MNRKELSELGVRLVEILGKKGIDNINKLERDAGVPDDFVRLLVKGYKGTMDFKYGCRLAAYLGIPAEEIAGISGANMVFIAPKAITPRWYKMPSDHMEPTINKDALVLIDYGQTSYNNPGIFLLEIEGEETIRRGALKSGGYSFTVDNRAYSLDDFFKPEALPKIKGTVLGIYKQV
jgi:hypothetical protein